MSADILKDLEKKAFSFYYKDGLFELFFAMLIIGGILRNTLPHFGASLLISRITGYTIIIGSSFVFMLLKKRITIPRVGYVKFSKERRDKIKRLHVILIMIVTISFFGFYLMLSANAGNGGVNSPAGPNITVSALMTLFILAVISFIGYMLNYPRLYLIAVLFAAVEPSHVYVQYYTELRPVSFYANIIPAIVLILLGSASMVTFLRTYPKPDQEVSHVD